MTHPGHVAVQIRVADQTSEISALKDILGGSDIGGSGGSCGSERIFVDELERVRFGPKGGAPPVMVRMNVSPLLESGEYACRLREVMASAIFIGSTQDFERIF